MICSLFGIGNRDFCEVIIWLSNKENFLRVKEFIKIIWYGKVSLLNFFSELCFLKWGDIGISLFRLL